MTSTSHKFRLARLPYGSAFKQIIYPLLFISWIALWAAGPSMSNGIILSNYLVTFSIAQLIIACVQKQMWKFILWLFISMYAFEPGRYFEDHENITIWRLQCQDIYSVYSVALYQLLFSLVLGYFLNIKYKERKSEKKGTPFQLKDHNFVWFICIVFGVLLLIFGKSGETILQSGGYGRGNVSNTTMYGYGCIPLCLALFYADTKKKLIITFACVACYVLKDLMFGGRVDSIILVLLYYIFYFRYKLTWTQTFLILFVGIVFNQAFEIVRTGIYERSFIAAIESQSSEFSFHSGNTSEVYYASMRIFYMIRTGALDLASRLESLICFLLSSFVPYNRLPAIANLAAYHKEYYGTGGGGLIVSFLYAWGGIFGVIFGAWAIARIVTDNARLHVGKYARVYAGFVFATVSRWYAYYPIHIIKFCVYAVLFFLICEMWRKITIPMLRSIWDIIIRE